MLDALFRRLTHASNVPVITPAELHQKMQAKTPLIVLDVRTPDEYAHDGHIAGSRLLPLHALAQRSKELPTDQPIVVVCRSGNRSHVACEQLLAQGFTDISNMTGGMVAWRRAGLPTR